MTINKFFIIDFDSTFVRTEGLEELAVLSLKNNPEKEKIIKQIKELTNQGMEGRIPFDKSLDMRLKLIQAHKSLFKLLVKSLKKKISTSVLRNKKFFKKFKDNIYIISGGFFEFIYPVVSEFGIEKEHVLANRFIYNKKGMIIGFDKSNLLAQKGGKVKAVRALDLKGEIHIVGDGYTDFEIKQMGIAKQFTAFTENVIREPVIEKADHIAPNFDEFLYLNRLPTEISYPKNRIKVLLLENVDNEAVKTFEKEGYTVEYQEKSIHENELLKKINNVSLLGIRSRTCVNKNLLLQANKLLAVGAFCIGVEQIDLKTSSERGVAVFNAPYSNTRSVVELVIGEIIMLARGIFDKNRILHQGTWNKSAEGSNEIRGKKLGIIGYGNIGTQLSVLAESMGMEVYFYDTVEKLALGNARGCRSLTELLKISDIITVHVDGRAENKNLISEREFLLMKDKVLFLNLSRGHIVDYGSLAKYIKLGKVRGAAVDVYPVEPKSRDDKLISPLQNLKNTILTPHIGGSTKEAQKNIAEFVSARIIEYVNTGNTYMSVNIPNLQLQKTKKVHRLLHLHKNVPGILAQINSVLATYKINILGQYLKTDDRIGYVITDVNKKYDREVIEKLKKIPNTIRFRVLY